MVKIIFIGTVASSLFGFRAGLIKLLVAKGYIVYAFATDFDSETRYKVEALGAVPVSYSLNRGGLNPLADIISTYQLAKKINRISPDLVFSYFSKPVIFGTLAARFAKVPKVIGMLEGLGYTFKISPYFGYFIKDNVDNSAVYFYCYSILSACP